jgi:sensor histidine kinase YesM
MNKPVAIQPSTKKQKWMTILIHFLCLCIIFILPEVIMSRSMGGGGSDRPVAWHIWLKSFVFVAVFYINYYFIIDRCLGKRYWVAKLLAWNLLLIIIAMSLTSIFMMVGQKPVRHGFAPHHESWLMFFMNSVIRDSIMMILTAALSVAMKLSDYWVKLNNQRKELEATQHREELQSLKNQLNPHFLFNTLNSIYALIAISPEKAQHVVHELSRLLRYVLYETSSSVPLTDELDFVESYVKLMKVRIGDRFPVTVTLQPGDCAEANVAPLIFISPIENAFKYGHNGQPDDNITISIIGQNHEIKCFVSNTFVPTEATPSSGIGLANLKRRLTLIYGDNAYLTTRTEGNTYIVELTIKLTEK